MSPRAQVKHLLLDVNFKDKPQVVNLEAEFSPLARLFYMDLMAAMSSATNARITKAVARVLGSRIGIDAEKSLKIIEFCLETGLLQLEGDMITNSRVIKDQESYAKKLEASNARVTRYREKSNASVTHSETRTPDTDNDNDSEYDPDHILISNSGAANTPDYSHYSPEEQEKFQKAESLLVPPEDPSIQSSSQFISAGRRPMRDYKQIWLTPHELVGVLDEFFLLKLEPRHRKKVFMKVASAISTKCAASGMQPDRISAFNWLTGFELTNALHAIKAEKDLQRSETYLDKSKER